MFLWCNHIGYVIRIIIIIINNNNNNNSGLEEAL